MLDIFRIAEGQEMTDELLLKFIRKNDIITNERYRPLWRAYNNDYPIFREPRKPLFKPDARLAANFAQYITDTFEGFFLGNPVVVTDDDEEVADYINDMDNAYDSDDLNAELSSTVSIFGRAYRIVYVDEDGNIGSAFLDPMESFAVYSDSITPRMRYFVRTYIDPNKVRRGSISDDTTVRYFHFDNGRISWDEEYPHGFNGVPAVEFVQNRGRRGIFESVLPLINGYNRVLSDKQNDQDAMANSYMKVLGAKIDEETVKFLRDNRILNLVGKGAGDLQVDFMSRPSADGTQENLLNRMERLIFTIAMVCNISDDNFATSSGIALRYKMLPMLNLAARKWRKFSAGLRQYYKLVCSNPVTPLSDDAWQGLQFTHLLNYPANLDEEATTAAKLSGITSRKTQLACLSIVGDVNQELERIADEAAEAEEFVKRTGGDDADEDT